MLASLTDIIALRCVASSWKEQTSARQQLRRHDNNALSPFFFLRLFPAAIGETSYLFLAVAAKKPKAALFLVSVFLYCTQDAHEFIFYSWPATMRDTPRLYAIRGRNREFCISGLRFCNFRIVRDKNVPSDRSFDVTGDNRSSH